MIENGKEVFDRTNVSINKFTYVHFPVSLSVSFFDPYTAKMNQF